MRVRALLGAAGLIAALGAGGCGGSSSPDKTTPVSTTAAAAQPAPAPEPEPGKPPRTPEELRAAKAVRAIYRALIDGDGRAFCRRMTPEGATLVATVNTGPAAKGDPAKKTCASNLRVFRRGYDKRTLRAASKLKVTLVEIDGKNATVTFTFPTAQTGTVTLVRSGGGWKLPGLTITMPSL